ncbi:hypothetical protein H5410_040489 [Solanum commersonii]|uniref:Uncharacterized protein n=1 Tax=Solanum commersonii TaxID=4109 RepID=A0A9J5XR20_SOLCO|nr:hypothetical protein H5410_040489 [Solanum commersonii]
MNAHKKTQLTYARINCALKDSSYDSPLAKILKFTILASNASSSSTMVLKCPHTKNDSIFTHNGSQFKVLESNATLTLTKMNTMHDFTHSSLKIKKVFSRLVMGLSAKVKALREFKRSSHTHKVGHKKRYNLKLFHTLQSCLRSYQEIALLSQPDQQGKFKVSSNMVYG